MLDALRARVDDRSATVGVAGLGYVGLPLAVELARAGFRVTGIDPDAGRVAIVSRGESHVGDIRSEDVAAVVKAGRLSAGTSWDVAGALDAIIICVPTPFTPNRWKAKEYDFYTNFITLAAEVNANMPYFVMGKLMRLLSHRGGRVLGSRVLLLGVTFKRNVADVRNSPALKLLELLGDQGIEVAYHDPLVPQLRIGGAMLESVPLTPERLAGADCVVVHTDHGGFNYDWIVEHARLVFDTRNAARDVKAGRDKVVRL